MASKGTSVADLVASVRKHKNFKRLAAYSMQALVKTAAPPNIGWQDHAREAFACGAAPVLAEVLAKDPEDAELLTCGLQALGAMASAGAAKGMLPQVTEEPHSILDTFATFWASAQRATSGSGADDDDLEAAVSISRSFTSTTLSCAAAGPDAAVEAGVLGGILAFLPHPEDDGDAEDAAQLPVDGLHAPTPMRLALQAMAACLRCKDALAVLAEPEALSRVVGACRVFDDDSVHSNKHILHGFRVADRLSRSEIGLQALRADGTLVARLAPAVEWAQRWPAAGAIGVRVLTRIVGQDVATLVSKAGGVDAEGAAVNVREAQFTAGLLASLASDASIVEQLLADDGALLLQVARLISTDAPSPRVAFSAMQAVRRAIATSGRAIIDAALAVGVPDFVCGLLRDEGMTRPGVEPFLLAEGLGLFSALLVSREAAAAINAAQGGHVHAWALQVAQMPASQDGVVAAACARYARALQLHAHWPEGVDACQWLAALVQLMGTFDEVPTLQLFGSEVLAGALRGPAASAAAAAAATLRAGIVKVLAAALKLAAEAGGSSSVSGSDDSPGSPSRSRSGSATHLGGVDDASAAAAALEGDSASKRRAASVLKRTPTIAGRLKPKRTVVPTEAATRVDGASLAVAAIELAAALRLAGGEEAMTKLNDGGTVSELLSAFLAHDTNVLVAGAYLLAVEVLLTEDAVDAAVRQLSGALNLIRESCVDKDLFSIARGELAGPGLLHSSDVTSGSLSGSVLGAAMDSIDSMKLLQAAAVSTRLAYHLIQSDGASLLVTFLSVLTLIKGVASLGKAPGGGGKGKAAGMGGKGANSRRLMGKLKTAVLLGGRRSMVERDKSLPETFQEDLLAATANVLANLIRLGSNQGAAGITQASSAAEAFTRRMLWTRRASPERVATLRAAATSRKAGSSLSPEARAVGLALLKPAVAKTAVKALNNKVHLQTAASSVCGMLGAMAAGDSVAVGILAAMVDVGSVEALTAALRTHAAAALVLVDRAARAMAVVAGWGLPTEDSFGAEAVATRGGSRQVLRELTTAFGSGDKRGKAAVANRWMGLEADGAGKVGPGAFLSASHLLHAVSGYEAGASLLKKQGAVDVLLSTLDALAEVEGGEGASAKGTHGALAQCRTVLTEVLTRLADASSVDDACSMLSRLTSTISSGKVKASTLRTAGIALTTLCALASSADGSASWSDVAAACQNLLAIAQGVRDGSVTLPPSVTLASLAPLLNQAVQLLSSLLAAGDTQREGWVDIALGSIPVLLNSLGEGSGDGSLAPADLLRALAAAVTSPEAASAVMAEETTLDSVLAMLTAAVDDWDPASVSAGMTLLARCADGGATDALAERGAHLLALRTAQDAIATAPALAAEWGPGSAADTASLALQAAASMAQSNAQAAADLSAAVVESVGIAASTVCARGIARICSAEQPLAEDFLGSALNLQLVLCSACGEEPLPPAQPADRLALGLRKALLAAVKAGAGREEYGTAAASALPLSLCVTSACTLETAHVADADALDDIREVLKRAGARDILIAAVSQSGVASEVVTAASQALAALDGGAGKAGAAGVATALRQQVLALRRHRLKVVSKAGHNAAARHRAVHFVRAVSRVGTAVSKLSATLASDPVLPSDVSQYVIAAVQEAMVALSACLGTLQDTAAVEFEEESATAAGAAEDEDEDEDEGLFVELDVSAGLGASAAALSALLQALARAWAAACADGEGTSTAETYLGEPSAVEALNTEVAQMDAEDASASAAELGSGSSGARLVARLGVFGACLALRSFMDAHGAPWTMDEEAGVSILQGVQSVLTALFPGSPALDAQGWAAVQSTGLLTLLTAVERGRTEAPDSISHMAQSAAADVLQHAIHAVLHHAPADGDSWPADTVQMIPSVLCAVVLAPSDSWVRELVRGLRAVLPSSAANAEPKAPAAGQLWAVLHALQEGGHTVHGPCLAVSPRGKVTLLDDSVQWDSSHPVVRSACSALSTALQQPPVDVKGPPCSRYDMPVLPLLPSLVHTAVASLHRAPKGSAEAPSESSPGPRHARTSTSMGAAGASPAQAASDPAAHWWAVDSTCSPDASAKVFSLLPALRALSHTDLDSAVVELRACEGLPGVASFSASVENAAPLLTESSVQHLKQWLGADVVVACAIVQVLRRVAGLGARAPHAANAARIERMASSGLLAAAAAGLVGAGSAGAGAQPSTEVADSAEHDVDLASLLPYELLSMEVVRLLADVALGDLDTTAMPGSGPLPDAVEALVVSALSGEGHSGVGVKACGFTEASLAALGGATKRIAVICGEEHPFHRRARTILAALGRVFEAYSGEGFAKALKAASKAAGVVMAEGAVPAEGEEAPPDGPWSELVSRLALLHRVCMNVDGDAIPQIPREDMEPLAGLLQLGAFQTHKEVSFRALLGIARACDNVQNLGCAIDAQVHRGMGKSLEAHPQDVDTVDVALTGLRPMTVSLQYLGDLKQAGIVPLVTKAGKDHAAAQLQPPPYKQIMTDEDAKDYPRIAHFAVQILANIACDKEVETVSDVLPADALVGAEEEHGGESMSGGVLRVVLAGGVEALGCIMSQHLDNPRILEDAMCALSNMAFTTDSVRLGIGRQCSTTVVQSLKVFDSDPYLFSMALRAIGNLTRCDENIVSVMAHGVGQGVQSGMEQCAEHPDALQVAADVVGNLASIDDQHLDKAQAVRALEAGLRLRAEAAGSTSEPMTQEELMAMDLAVVVAEWLYDDGVPQVLAETMKANYADSSIVSACLRAIQYLTETPSVLLRLTQRTSLAADVVFVMRSCDHDAELCLRGGFLLAQMLKPMVSDLEEQERIAAVTRKACMEAGVQTVLLSVLDTHRREDYVVSQLIKIANLASKDEHLATICTAAVQLKTATSLLWVARRSAVAIVHPERLEAFDAADRRGALDDEEDEEDEEEDGSRAAGGAQGVETMEMPLAGPPDGAVAQNRDLRKVDPMQLCQQALGLLSVWAEDPDFSQAVATEVGEACVELYRTFDEAKQHALQYAVLRVMARVASTQPACVALVKVQGVPEILGQFCWDQDRMLTDKVSSKAVELTGALSGASFQGASLLMEAGVNWVVEALALRYAILGEDAPYAACGAVLESLYTGEARFRKLARNKRSSGGARRLQLAAVLEDLTEEGSEEADGEAEAAEESAEEVPEWQARMVAGIVPFDDFPKGTLAALTSGAELDIWFCPFMHRSGKVKVRTMRVKLDSSLNLIQVLYFSSRQQCDLLWAVALRDATAIRVGAPTHGIKRQIFRRSAKAERSLCIDGPASAAYNRGADGTVQQEAGAADEGGEAGKAPITLLHIELSSPDEAVEVRNVLSMVQSFSRCQKAISVAGIKSKLALGGLEDVAGEPEPPVEEAAAQE